MSTDVFISYSKRDKSIADDACKAIESVGLQCWIAPRDVDPGDEWAEAIIRGINATRVMVLIFSAHANTSNHIKREVERAANRGMPIVTFQIEKLPPSPTLEFFISTPHCLDACTPPIEQHLNSLSQAVLRLVRKPLSGRTQAGATQTANRDPVSLPLTARSDANQGPPTRWTADWFGWIPYLRSANVHRELNQRYLERRKRRMFPLNDDSFRNEVRTGWGQPVDLPKATETVVAFHGPGGVGKTTLVNELLSRLALSAAVILDLPVSDLAGAVKQNDPIRIWKAIYQSYDSLLQNNPLRARVSRLALAHALNKRRVVVCIEDFHMLQDGDAALALLRSYFIHHHRYATHLTFIITTRVLPSDFSGKVHSLSPLSTPAAQQYFGELLIQNGVPVERLVEMGREIQQAFQSADYLTPLFIVICAWLALRSKNPASVLGMTEMSVFRLFIEELYKHSILQPTTSQGKSDIRSLEEFRRNYEDIALLLWPNWRDWSPIQIAPQFVSHIEYEFLVVHGFLYRDDANRYSFPHQKLAEYLVAEALVREGDFNKLRSSKLAAMALVPFLAELTRQRDDLLLRLMETDLDIAAAMLKYADSHPMLRGRNLPMEIITTIVRDWAECLGRSVVPAETWRIVEIALRQRVRSWTEDFIEMLGEEPATANSLFAVSALPGEVSHRKLLAWLVTPVAKERFHTAFKRAPEGDTHRQLYNFLVTVIEKDGLATVAGRSAVRISWENNLKDMDAVLDKWLGYNIVRIPSELVTRMIDDFPDSARRLAKALSKAAAIQSQNIRRRISSAFVKAIGKVLICTGEYAVRLPDDRQVTVRINQPFFVPREAKQLSGKYQTNVDFSHVRNTLETITPIANLMTAEQACVAHFHYAEQAHGDDREGMIFGGRGAASYEALRESPNKLMLCYLKSTGNSYTIGASTAGPNSQCFVHYRIVERL